MKRVRQPQLFLLTWAFILGVLLHLTLGTVVLRVEAQTPTPTSETVLPDAEGAQDALPFQSPSVDQDELGLLRERYKTELSVYRDDERAYQIAKEQFNKLGTLNSLEAAVKATQKVMNSRVAVLETYLKMIKIAVSGTPGIDINEKATVLQEIDAASTRLKQHQEVLKLAVDRIKLAEAVADYTTFHGQITSVVYKSLSYVAYGRIQTVYDKTVAVRNEVKANLEEREKNGLVLGEKRRAMEEIDRRLSGTTEKMRQAKNQFQPDRFGRPASFSQGSYATYVNDLSQIYAELLRAVEYFREVTKP